MVVEAEERGTKTSGDEEKKKKKKTKMKELEDESLASLHADDILATQLNLPIDYEGSRSSKGGKEWGKRESWRQERDRPLVEGPDPHHHLNIGLSHWKR